MKYVSCMELASLFLSLLQDGTMIFNDQTKTLKSLKSLT